MLRYQPHLYRSRSTKTTHTSSREENIGIRYHIQHYHYRSNTPTLNSSSADKKETFSQNGGSGGIKYPFSIFNRHKIIGFRFYSSDSNQDENQENKNKSTSDSSNSHNYEDLNKFEKEQENMVYGKSSKTPDTEEEARAWFSKLQGRKRQKLRKQVHQRILQRGGRISPEEFHKELESLYKLSKMSSNWEGHLKESDKRFRNQIERQVRSWALFAAIFILFLLVLYQWQNQLYMENAELIMDLLSDPRPERRVAAFEAAAKFLENGAAVLTVMKQPHNLHDFNNDPIDEYDDRDEQELTWTEKASRKLSYLFGWYRPNLEPIMDHRSSSRSFPHTIEEMAEVLVSGIIDSDSRVRHAARKLLCQGAASYDRFEESLLRNQVLSTLLKNLFVSPSNKSETSQNNKLKNSNHNNNNNNNETPKTMDEDVFDGRTGELFQRLLKKERYQKYLLKEPTFLESLVGVVKTSVATVNSQSNPLKQEQDQKQTSSVFGIPKTKESNEDDSHFKIETPSTDSLEAELEAMKKPYTQEDDLSLARFKLELVMSVLVKFVSSVDIFSQAISDIKFQRAINYLSVLDIPEEETLDSPDIRRIRQVKKAAKLIQNFEPSGQDYSNAIEKLNEVFSFTTLKTELNSYLNAVDMPSNLTQLFARDVANSISFKSDSISSPTLTSTSANNSLLNTSSESTNETNSSNSQGSFPSKEKQTSLDNNSQPGMISAIRQEFAASNLLKIQWGYAIFCVPLSFLITRRHYLREKILPQFIGRSIRYWLLVSAIFPFRQLWRTSYGVEYANAVNTGYLSPHAIENYQYSDVTGKNNKSSSLMAHAGAGFMGGSMATLTDLLALRTAFLSGSFLYSAPYWLLFPIHMFYDDRHPVRLSHLLNHAYFTKTNPFRIRSPPKK